MLRTEKLELNANQYVCSCLCVCGGGVGGKEGGWPCVWVGVSGCVLSPYAPTKTKFLIINV